MGAVAAALDRVEITLQDLDIRLTMFEFSIAWL
jgi:hypothetical protein